MNANASKLPIRPRIPSYFHIVPMDNGRIQFRTVGKTIVMRGKVVTDLISQLIEQLDGNHTIPEITAHLNDFGEQTILAALQRLQDKGLLEDAALVPPANLSEEELRRYGHQLTLFSRFKPNKYEVQSTLKSSQVIIFGLGGIGSWVLYSLSSAGVGRIRGVDAEIVRAKDMGSFYLEKDIGRPRSRVAARQVRKINRRVEFEGLAVEPQGVKDVEDLIEGYNLVIACEDTPSVTIYRWLNEACLGKETPWISGSLEGYIGRVGPAIVPRQTACYECYQLRLKSTLDAYDEFMAFERYLQEEHSESVSYGGLSSFGGVVGNYLALEALKMLTNFTSPVLYNKILMLDFLTLEASLHDVLKLPRCPACSSALNMPMVKAWEGG